MEMSKFGTCAAVRDVQIRKMGNSHFPKKRLITSSLSGKWMRYCLPLLLMLMSGLMTAQDARLECPLDEMVSCEADLMPSSPTLFITDATRVISDDDKYYGIMGTENYEDNPTVILPEPNIPQGASLTGAELRIFFRVEQNSCEEDIDIRVTSPSGIVTEFISPLPGCSDNNNTLHLFSEMLDITGVEQANVDEWLIELRDSDDQNTLAAGPPSVSSPAGTEFSVRFTDIYYFMETPEEVSDFSSELTVNGQPNCSGTDYTYTYEVAAPSGDIVSCEQTFTIANDPPTISCAGDVVVGSAANIVLGNVDVETSCGLEAAVDISNPIIVGEPDAPGTTYTYTYTATDECGRQATCQQTFKIQDIRLVCPPDGLINCEADLAPSAPSLLTKDTVRVILDNDLFYGTMDTENYADNPPLVLAGPDLSDGKLLSGAELRIFVKVENNSCEEDIDIRVTSPSGGVTEFISSLEGCSDNNNTLYTFSEMLDVTGVDQGNVGDWLIELRDSDDQNALSAGPPSVFSPAGTEFSVRFTDINYFVEIPEQVSDFSTELTVNGQPDCPGTTYIYTYEVLAPTGDLVSCEQIFTIENDPPTITCPADEVVTCAADIVPGTADFETSCDLGGSVDVSEPVVVGEPDCSGTTYTYTFTGTDACGRTATCEQVFTIQNDPPVITCAEHVTVSCATEISVSIPALETSCQLGGGIAVDGPVIIGAPNCEGTTYTYTFTGTDDCGRMVSCEQVFTIANDTTPTISCPAGGTVFCAADIIVDPSDASFSTSCGVEGTVSISDAVIVGEPDCPGTTYTYTYTVEDVCGKTATCEQVFTISNVGPIISCPLGITVACSTDIVVDVSNIFFATSCDVEGEVSVSDPVIVGAPDCAGTTYTYTYTVEDVCGRTLSCQQTFTIENTPPTITCPADEVVACAGDISVDAADAVFTTDCDLGTNVSLSGSVIDGEPDCAGTTYTYTYTVEDACGRTASCEQVFTISNDMPTIACPEDATVACSADISVDVSNAVFTTNCDIDTNVSLSNPVIIGAPDCPGTTYTYTYTIEDACGRMASCEQVFTIENDPPTITCPADEVVTCAEDIIPGTANFETNCGLETSVEVSEPAIVGEPDCPGTTYTYTFTGTDACGRTVSCEQIFTIENDPPVITCADGETVACATDISVSIPAFDTSCDLGANVAIAGPMVDGEPNCNGTTYTYSFTGTDDCGRTAICEQVFTILNNEPPTISCPAGATVFCSADILVGTEDIVFTTSCDVGGTVSISEPVVDGEPDCPGTTYTYTYTVEDACGRTASCEQVFTIANSAPITSCPLGAEVACSADIEVDISNVFFVTSCDVEGTVTLSGPVIVGEPDCPGTTYTYTYTVEDVCDRTLSCEQTFTIANDPPTITCPADEVVACEEDIAVNASNAAFTTSCEVGAEVSLSAPVLNGEPNCPGTTYTYTYTVQDACGRTASCEQIFTIENDPPTITCPADATVACSADILVDPTAVFTTGCDLGANVSLSDPVLDGEPDCPGTTYTYTYTVEDACGRTASCEQIFTIENDPPTITCPADEVVTCAVDIILGTADFQTSCELGSLVEVTDPIIIGEPDCPGTTYTYTFIGTDDCGRIASCEQVFTIQNAAPTITCPEDATVSCAAEIAIAIPVFDTSCGLEGGVAVDGPVIDGTPNCEGTTYTYIFTGTDACGRTASCEQVFTIVNDPPTITCPAGATVFCSADIMVDAEDAVFATSCDVDGTVSVSEPVVDGEPDCPGTTYTYTYTVEDVCGRTASCEQVFTIANSSPIASCPLDAVVACSADIVVDASDVTFVTSCDVEGTVTLSGPVIVGEPDCPGTTYTYTYTVEDVCGRTLSCEQTFTIANDPPTITCPADETVACSTDISVDASNATFATSCELGADVSLSGPVLNGEPDCPGTTYTYTYTVEDVCGRTATCEQVFTIQSDPPTISCPADEVVACAADILVDASNAVFTAGCELGANVSLSGPVINGIADCPGTTYTYTYTVEDACGITATCEQIFTIENAPPTITCPADEVVTCAVDIILGTADFQTSCELESSVEVTGPIILGEPDCPGTTYTYTFTGTDDCGRTASCEQVFTIENEEPVITCPEDATVSCALEIIVAIPVFDTSCGLEGGVEVSGPVVDGTPNCEGTTYTYTFTGTDACGRTASCEQVFTIVNDPPTITCPAGATVFCSADIMVDAEDAVFATSCDVDGTVSVSEPVVDGEPDCPGTTYTYTYTVEDVCGRTASCEQVFTIANSSPIASCPLDAVVACSADIVVDASDVTFVTSCDVEGTVTLSGPVIVGEPDCPGTTYTYTYIVEDVCGRTLSCEQTFTIENAAPTITCPANEVVTCAADISVDASNAAFTTSCELGADVSLSEAVINGEPDCPGTTYTYTYIVEDVCGRMASCEQVFTIENDPPTITCPADEMVACATDIAVDASNAIFTSSCGVEIDASVSGPIIDGTADCPGATYTYTYTGEDVCGRTVSCEQVFTIENDPPTITCPADTMVACASDIILGMAIFETSCELGIAMETSGPIVVGTPDCPGTTYTYTFTGTDECGREVSCQRIFTIQNEEPEIICPEDKMVSCAAEILIEIPIFNTGCQLGGSVAVVGPVVSGTPNCEGTTYTYTFIGTDGCDRTVSCSQIFTISNELPTLSCPEGAMVFCSADIVVDTEDVVFTTSCDVNGTVSISEPVIDGEPDCPGTTYTYTYIVEDACGRTGSCEQVFTIANAPPIASCPLSAEVACSADIEVDVASVFFATSCDVDGEVSLSGPVILGEPDCPGTTYVYTYTIEDACGRTLSCEQTFTIVNDEPTIVCPADEVIACSADILVDASNAALTTSCELGADVTLSGPVIDGEPDCPGSTYTYTYTVEDACGRTASCDQIFTIENDEPTIACPADEAIACSADIMVDISDVTFTTSCDADGSVNINGPVVSGTADCPGTTYAYTYTLEDACGRTASCERIFTIENDPPTITCPADTMVACASDIIPGMAIFGTSCDLGIAMQTSGPVVVGTPDCSGTTYTYTFTGTDGCGREATCQRVFTIQNEEPEIVCPEDKIIGCASEILLEIPIFNTGCQLGGNVLVSGPFITGAPNCEGTTYGYTFTGTDDCGRTVDCSQVFTIGNTLTITCPADTTVACSADIMVDAMDVFFSTSCDLGAEAEVSSPVVDGVEDCPGTTYTYTYTVEDACGRTATCEQVFTIANDPPTISCPADTMVACATDIMIDTAAVFFESNCGVEGTVSVSEPIIVGEPDCMGTTYTYTYTLEDACDRTATCEQVFTIVNDLPTISCPADTIVACAADIVVDIASVSFATSCGVGGTVSVSEAVISDVADCSGTTHTYTYTVEDACGRTATCEQVFTIENAAPTISCPADTIVVCAADILFDIENVLFTTSCGVDGMVSVSGPEIIGDPDCPGSTYTYTYTVEDACGRTASCEQVFAIEDSPLIVSCPLDTTVFCEEDIDVDTENASFTTSCDVEGIVIISQLLLDGIPDCTGTTYTYIYTVEDACGRVASCEQIFTIENDPPTITCPADTTVFSAEDIVIDTTNVIFTTSCNLEAMVSVSEPIIDGVPDTPGTTYTYTYTVEDICGRAVSCQRVFTINDDPPQVIGCAPDMMVTCAADIVVDIADVSYVSNCNSEVTVSIDEPLVLGDPDCPGTAYVYVYTVKNDCGTDTCERIFTIENDAPKITCPEDKIVTCTDEIIAGIPQTITSCDLDADITISEPTLVSGIADCGDAIYEIEYIVKDNCGRAASCIQTFTVINDAPTISCPEGCLVVVCASDIQVGTPEFTTTCGLSGTLSVTGPVIEGESGVDGSTYIYTHTVTDDCGRTASCEQVFTIGNECKGIDFDFDDAGNALLPGTEISDQYEDFTVTTNIPGSCPQLFDTGNPTANDFDVGTPNEQYGGPGIGAGGASNTEFQGNALVFSQSCGVPNETDGELIFTFDCGVTIKTVDLLDIPCDDADIELYDVNQNLIEILILPNSGINGFYEFEVNVSGVYTMIVDLDCGGGVTAFSYCKDNTPGANCDATPSLCYDYNIDHSDCGAGWETGATSGIIQLGDASIDVNISDPNNILDNTQAEGVGLLVRSDPNTVDDEVIITYDLSKSSENVVFDIIDIDLKNTITGQQEEVCVYGTLGNNPTQILPTITSLEGSVIINGNCAEGGANSAESGQDESILVEFTQCIDKITIVYGSGMNSPTPDPDNSKIIIGGGIFSVEQCKEGCECPEDGDNDGACDDEDICPGGDDFMDTDGDGTPDFCDDDCAEIGDEDGDFVCDDLDQCPGFDDNIDENNNGIPDACDVFCDEFILNLSSPNYNWSGELVESFTVGNQAFDISIADDNGILTNSTELESGLSVRTDPNNVNEQVVVRYQLSQVSSSVTFDITDIDYKVSQQQEEVCIYGTLGGDPTQILPMITSLDGSVAIDGNCAEGAASSSESGQDESILVEFTDCIDEVVILYGSGSILPIDQDPEDSKIVIGQDFGFVTEVCTNNCPELRMAVDSDVNTNINLYPNPVYGSGNITIEINTEARGDAQIILVDAFGRVVSTENIQLMNNFTIHEINADPLSAGIYFVQLQTQEWRTDGLKFIVVKP